MNSRKYTQLGFDRYIESLPYPPNPFQLKVLHSIAFGEGNILVSALAGSGKTTLLMQIAELLKRMAVKGNEAMFLAFNKKIREEMDERLPAGFSAINSHSLGLQVLNTIRPGSKFDNSWKKWRDITDPLVKLYGFSKDSYRARRMLENLCSKVMMSNIKLVDLSHNEKSHALAEINRIASHYSIGGSDGDEEGDSEDTRKMLEALIPLVPQVLQKAKEVWELTGLVNFDEMLYWPIALNLPMAQVEYVFVDECQDLNELQQQLAIRSCKLDGRMVFVGDKKQAIYGFAGADAAAFGRIQGLINADVLPLNICYRCPPEHLDLARAIVPEIEAAPNAKPGIIEYAENEDFLQKAGRGTLIMNRITAPLVESYFKLIEHYATKPKEQRIPVKMLGRDIAAMLGGIIDKVAKMPAFNYERINEFLDRYESMQREFLIQREASESQLIQLADSVRVLQICVENFTTCTTVVCLKKELTDLFGDEKDKGYNQSNYITLLTVHRAKGLEADHTMILQPDKMPLVWKGQQLWEFEQEMNILYVALTRSKNRLTVRGAKDSLRVDATPDETNARKFGDFETIQVREDITDSLPDVKLEIVKSEKQLPLVIADPLPQPEQQQEPQPIAAIVPEPEAETIVAFSSTNQNSGSSEEIENSATAIEPEPITKPADFVNTDAAPVADSVLPASEFIGSGDREVIASLKAKVDAAQTEGGLFGDLEPDTPAEHAEPDNPEVHLVPTVKVDDQQTAPETAKIDSKVFDAQQPRRVVTGNLKADLKAFDANRPPEKEKLSLSSHKRNRLETALETITDPKVCDTLIALLQARKADLESAF